MKFSHTERRALAELAKPFSRRDYSTIREHTIHALERKGLYGFEGRSPRKRVTAIGRAELAVPDVFTAVGRAELAVPDVFDDLFEKRKLMMTNAEISNHEISNHPLLSRDQQKTCRALRDLAKKEHRPFTMLDFAEIALRATGNDFAAVTDQVGPEAVRRDADHRRAAILYVYESIKAGPPIVAETAAERGTLRDLELLASHM